MIPMNMAQSRSNRRELTGSTNVLSPSRVGNGEVVGYSPSTTIRTSRMAAMDGVNYNSGNIIHHNDCHRNTSGDNNRLRSSISPTRRRRIVASHKVFVDQPARATTVTTAIVAEKTYSKSGNYEEDYSFRRNASSNSGTTIGNGRLPVIVDRASASHSVEVKSDYSRNGSDSMSRSLQAASSQESGSYRERWLREYIDVSKDSLKINYRIRSGDEYKGNDMSFNSTGSYSQQGGSNSLPSGVRKNHCDLMLPTSSFPPSRQPPQFILQGSEQQQSACHGQQRPKNMQYRGSRNEDMMPLTLSPRSTPDDEYDNDVRKMNQKSEKLDNRSSPNIPMDDDYMLLRESLSYESMKAHHDPAEDIEDDDDDDDIDCSGADRYFDELDDCDYRDNEFYASRYKTEYDNDNRGTSRPIATSHCTKEHEKKSVSANIVTPVSEKKSRTKTPRCTKSNSKSRREAYTTIPATTSAALEDTIVSVGSETNDSGEFRHSSLILKYASSILAKHIVRMPRGHDKTIMAESKKKRLGTINSVDADPHNHFFYHLRIPHKPASEWKLLQLFLQPHTIQSASVTLENMPSLIPWFHQLQWMVQLQTCDALMVEVVTSLLPINNNRDTMNLHDQLFLPSSIGDNDDNSTIKTERDILINETRGEASITELIGIEPSNAKVIINIRNHIDEVLGLTDESRKLLQRQALIDVLYMTRIACKVNLTKSKRMGLHALTTALRELRSVWLHSSSISGTNENEAMQQYADCTMLFSSSNGIRASDDAIEKAPIARFQALAEILLDCLRQDKDEDKNQSKDGEKKKGRSHSVKQKQYKSFKAPGHSDDNSITKDESCTSSTISTSDDEQSNSNLKGEGIDLCPYFDSVEGYQLFQTVIAFLPPDLVRNFVDSKTDVNDKAMGVKTLLENPLLPYLFREGMISCANQKKHQQDQEKQQIQSDGKGVPGEDFSVIVPPERRDLNDSNDINEFAVTKYNFDDRTVFLNPKTKRNYNPNTDHKLGGSQLQTVANDIQTSFSALCNLSWIMDTNEGDDESVLKKNQQYGNKIFWMPSKPMNQIDVRGSSTDTNNITSVRSPDERRRWLQLIWEKLNEPPLFADDGKNDKTETQVTGNDKTTRIEESLTYSDTSASREQQKIVKQRQRRSRSTTRKKKNCIEAHVDSKNSDRIRQRSPVILPRFVC